MTDSVASNVGELGTARLRPLYFGGHCYYTRKCTTGDQFGPDFWRRRLGGIEIPETAIEHSLTVEVLAIGPKVGKPCSKHHRKLFERVKCLDPCVRVGDLLLCPNRHSGIQISPLVDYEFFIEESVPLAIWRNANGRNGSDEHTGQA